MTNQLTHYRYIDALRGFAFLGVLTVHASQQAPSMPGLTIAAAGIYGVQLFFLLSSITLLRSVSLRSRKERAPLRNFFIRRFFRIAPLFWRGIAFYALVDGLGPRHWAPNGVGLWQLATTFAFLHGWTPASINSVVPGGWSIAVEMTFYLCLPILARRVSSFGSALAVAFYTMVGAILLNHFIEPIISHSIPSNEQYLVSEFLYFWFPSQLSVFFVGIMIYYALHSEAFTRLVVDRKSCAVLAIGSVCLMIGLSYVTSPIIPLHLFYTGAFSVLILSLAARPFTFVVNKATCNLGVLSFSCYLTHFAALKVTGRYIKPEMFAFAPQPFAPLLHFVVVWLIALGLTLLASTVTYFLIEKPGIKLGNKIISHFEKPETVSRNA